MYNVMYTEASLIRKQIYIGEKHQEELRRLAERRGVSEAEVIRDAISRLSVSGSHPLDPEAWARALKLMRSRVRPRNARRAAGKWKRNELYDERLDRYERNPG